MELQSEKIGEISQALTNFQKECPVLDFDGEAKLKGNSKAGNAYEYGYKYLTLPKLRRDTRDYIAKNDLALFQTTMSEGGQFFLVTTLSHKSGEWLRGYYVLVADMKDPQKLGSVMSYAKRYAMSAILGVVADDDDDGEYGNAAREDREQAAAERQRVIEAKAKEEKRVLAINKKMALEMALDNCKDLAELTDTFTNRCRKDLSWLRIYSPSDYDDMIIKKNELKESYNA